MIKIVKIKIVGSEVSMASHFKLMSQYNLKKSPIDWDQFFSVFTKKDSFHVAVEYFPDSFITIISKKKFAKLKIEKNIGYYDFIDDSFIDITQKCLKLNYEVRYVDWNKDAVDYLQDDIDLEKYEKIDDFPQRIVEIRKKLPDYIQSIDKITIQSQHKQQIQISTFGEITFVGDLKSQEIKQLITKVLL